MDEVKKVRTVCRSCHGGCGIIAHVKGGKVTKVEGDPDSPISHGTLCTKGLSITQLADIHPWARADVLFPIETADIFLCIPGDSLTHLFSLSRYRAGLQTQIP